MPGFPPPLAGPPPDPPGTITADVGLANVGQLVTPPTGFSFGATLFSKPAFALCGFTFPPPIPFKFGFQIPPFAFPPPLPSFFFSLSLNCSLSNPIGVKAGLKWGGGRSPNTGPDPDALEQAA